jgi:hypothetical protein
VTKGKSTYSNKHSAIEDKLRKIILSVSDDISETVKWGWPTFMCNRNFYNIVQYKNHVNLHFFNGTRMEDPENRLVGTGKGMRHLSFKTVGDIDESYIRKLVKSAIKYNNRERK